MKMRWLAAGVTGVLIVGGTMTVAQRVITQKTRGVLPEANDSAHLDSRPATPPVLAIPTLPSEPTLPPPAVAVAVASAPEPVLLLPAGDLPPAPIQPTVAVTVAEPTAGPDPDPVLGQATQPPPPADPGPVDTALSPANATPTPGPAPQPGPRDVLSDPVQSVESFVEQNRREADQAIQTLTSEAENLKTRLSKVEAALTRWQTFSRALNVDMPPPGATPPASEDAVAAPTTKGKWGQRKPENPEPTAPAAQPEPVPALSPAEVPASPGVPPATDPGLSSAPEPKAADSPSLPPPGEPAPLPGPVAEPATLPKPSEIR